MPKAAKSYSVFRKTRATELGLDGFGSSRTDVQPNTAAYSGEPDGNRVITNTTLSPNLSLARDESQSGLASGLQRLNTPLDQQLSQLDGGQNPFYNLQQEINNRYLSNQLSSANARYSQSGLENSTVRGALEGQLINDSLLQDLSTRAAVLEQERANNLGVVDANNQVNNSLFNISKALGDSTNATFMEAQGQALQSSIVNAQLENQMRMLEAQIQAQKDAQKGSILGNILSGGLSLAGAVSTGGLGSIGSLLSSGISAASRLFGGGSSLPTSGLNSSLFNSALNNSYLNDRFLGTSFGL